jgi:L-ornithine N5-monooxygenase
MGMDLFGGGCRDIVGVGFGPSNLALAIALTEAAEVPDAVFLERQQRFGWHRGMLLDDATMQVSFLKDLVTLRDPTSRFSFLAYLHGLGRLVDFINHKTLFPLRAEFHDYLEWAASQLTDLVHYGSDVVAIRPVTGGGTIDELDVVTRTEVYRTRNLVFGTGLVPYLPDGQLASPRVWHSHDLLRRVSDLDPRAASRFVVVGAGQSAAEVTAFLHATFPAAEVCAVHTRFGYSPADDSPFANRVFDPASVDDFFAAPDEVKEMILDYHGNTNYSVVDLELIDELYRRSYRERVLGRPRLRWFNVSRLVKTEESASGVTATVESMITGERTVLDVDVLVYGTGYREADPTDLLGELAGLCHRDDRDRIQVDRDYQVRTRPELPAGIYLQGGTEHTHGLASSLLSNSAVRAGEILASIQAQPVPSVTR